MPFNLQNFRVLTTPPNSFLSFILAVAGDMCEYRVTNTCDNPASPSPNTTLDSALGMATQGEAFCVNDALCLLDDTDSTNPMYYCDCDGTGHEGKHCEYLLPEEVVPVPAGTPTASPTAKYTDTWSPTMLGSVTDQPTDEPSSGETVDSSKADDGLFMDGIDMGSSSEDSVNDDRDDDDDDDTLVHKETTETSELQRIKQHLAPVRKSLPVYQHRTKICELVQHNDVLLVVAETVRCI